MSESDRPDREDQARDALDAASVEPPADDAAPMRQPGHDVTYYDSQFAAIIAHWDDALAAIPDEERSASAPEIRRPTNRAVPPLREQDADLNPGASPAPGASPTSDLPGPGGPGSHRRTRGEPAAPSSPPPGEPDEDAPQPAAAGESGWRSYEAVDDPDDEHYVPPPPKPLPRHDPTFYGALVGMVLGPLLLLYLVLFDQDAGTLWVTASIVLTLGGFALLVLRQPRRRSYDGDDGARL